MMPLEPFPAQNTGGMAISARPLAAVGLAVLLLVALASYEHDQSGSATVLQQQRLNPAVHKALLSLAKNLEGELKGVRGVLSAVDGEEKVKVRGEALAADVKTEPAPAEETEGEAWAKKTMQQGAMRKESVSDQLKKVLARELQKELEKKTQWKSVDDISKAEQFGDYLKTHPLPVLAPKRAARAVMKADGGDVEKGSGKVERIEFKKRDDQMTQEEYKSLEKDLERVASQVEADRQAVDHKGDSAAGTTHEDGGAGEGGGDAGAGREGDSAAGSKTHAAGAGAGGGDARAGREAAAKRAARTRLQGFFDPAAAGQKLRYRVQPGDKAIVQADRRGHGWAERESLREHGDFVRLARDEARIPLAIRPYWDDALPQ